MADNINTPWGGNSVSIQHPLPGQIITPNPVALSTPSAPAASITIDHTTDTPADKPITLTEGGSYPVAHGDTLDSIAAKYSLSTNQLKSLNPHLENKANIYPGQLLTIEAQPAAVAPPSTSTTPVGSIGPSQSTYTMANKHELEAAVHQELSGWLGTAGTGVTDPAKNLIEAAEKPKTDTDPLKVQHK
jgi:LysM repeat protein